ncbi:hypothetical protein ACFP9V_09040 [Deinococcus radiopugnans]|uniref:hypothetical protein n=1 Tax=Deinococcus radiopugnans TaxID=57497 RepID=UPI00360763AC
MPLSAANAVPLDGLVSEAMVQEAARTCAHLLPYVVDRADLHGRDPLEKFHNLLMGEIAELAVIAYLTGQERWPRPPSTSRPHGLTRATMSLFAARTERTRSVR